MTDRSAIEHIRGFLSEDRGYGDITTALLDPVELKGEIYAKEDMVVSGISEAFLVFRETGAHCSSNFSSGDRVCFGDVVLEVRGPATAVLSGERLALNILMRMSGIATYVSRLKGYAKGAQVAATRKTTPGFRYFEKKAVLHGGGDPHRYRLDDMFLIKENHISAAGGMELLIRRARASTVYKKIEVEVSSVDDATEAAELGADIIMLDNLSPEEVRVCASRIREIDEKVVIEVSGNINEDNIADYAPYVDIISCGAITHSAPSVDLSMRVIPGD